MIDNFQGDEMDYIDYLEAKIEKMKCCDNCGIDNMSPDHINNYCNECKNNSKWELIG